MIDLAAGHIPITVLLTFNKLKAITTDPAVVARALEEGGPSTVVAVSWELTDWLLSRLRRGRSVDTTLD